MMGLLPSGSSRNNSAFPSDTSPSSGSNRNAKAINHFMDWQLWCDLPALTGEAVLLQFGKVLIGGEEGKGQVSK
jgi:hypothetical protein